MDAVGKTAVDELGYPGQQRVSGVELVDVVAAETVEVVDDQEHLTEAVVGDRAVAVPVGLAVPERFPALASQQQLLQLAERAADAFGFEGGGDAADMRQLLQGAHLSAAVVQAVEGDVAR